MLRNSLKVKEFLLSGKFATARGNCFLFTRTERKVKKLLSASEIAALKLPGLPGTKVGVRNLADREGWRYEERKGVGGTRRVYEVPARYVGQDTARTSLESPRIGKVVGAIAAGTAKVDTKKLTLAIRALDEWEKERGVKVSEDRRPAVISVLYGFLERGDDEELAVLLKALG